MAPPTASTSNPTSNPNSRPNTPSNSNKHSSQNPNTNTNTNGGTQAVGSKRWTHFHAALQLAIQRAAHKWTYEDFSECFAMYCEEQEPGATGIFNTVSNHFESSVTQLCDEIFATYAVQHNIDILHKVVTDGRARKQALTAGRPVEERKDLWREDLQPRNVVRARTVPVLEKEGERLRRELARMEAENMKLEKQLRATVREREEADRVCEEIFAFLEDIENEWKKLPLDDIQTWTLETAEAQKL